MRLARARAGLLLVFLLTSPVRRPPAGDLATRANRGASCALTHHPLPAIAAPRPRRPTTQMLATRRVLSAPVKLSTAPEAGAGDGATIFGFVDVRDIVSSFFTAGA
jgi:hypothetical protein